MLRFLTSGESHGVCLTAIIEGMPSGLALLRGDIDKDLARRQGGYGRGGRMTIEKDRVEITAGVRNGQTLGSPISLIVKNRDWENWKEIMSADLSAADVELKAVTRPRPGHADLPGALKYNHSDMRNILERSSARETAARVAVGAVCRKFLEQFGISVFSWVVDIGSVNWQGNKCIDEIDALFKLAESSDVRCPDAKISQRMRKRIDRARKDGDSLGGVFEIAITGVPPGLGSHVQWDRKLDGNIARALMSIQAIKGVEIGMGFGVSERPGSKVHDEIFYTKGQGSGTMEKGKDLWPMTPRFYRKTNNAGGIEGGMSNGETIIIRAAMKPIPTLYKPLRSVDIKSKEAFKASVERSDICAVPAASVVGEAAVAFEIANVFMEKFSGDSIAEIRRNYRGYLDYLRRF